MHSGLSAITFVDSEVNSTMKIKVCLFYAVLVLTVATITTQQTSTLKLVPELKHLWLMKGDPLKLDCSYIRPDSTIPQTFDFYHNDVVTSDRKDGFEVYTSPTIASNNALITTLTLRKNRTDLVDGGVFKCKTQSDDLESSLTVHFFLE